MKKPIDPTVAGLVDLLDDNLAEMFQERAAVREYDGGYNRAHSEAVALLDVINRYPEALSGVTVFAIELEGNTQWIVTTDRDLVPSGRTLGHIKAVATTGVAEIVRKKFGGRAFLSATESKAHV